MILGVKKSKKWKMTPPPRIKHRRVKVDADRNDSFVVLVFCKIAAHHGWAVKKIFGSRISKIVILAILSN